METPPAQPHPWATVGMGKRGDYHWFDPTAAIGHGWGRNLPHWRQRGAIYFVTFRTADSIPAPVLTEWQRERAAWLAAHPEPHDDATTREYHRLFTERMHRFLDDCHGDCPFRSAESRRCVVEVLTHLDGMDDGGSRSMPSSSCRIMRTSSSPRAARRGCRKSARRGKA